MGPAFRQSSFTFVIELFGQSSFFCGKETGMMQLEICVDSVESAVAAEQGGAHRVELCSALSDGGLTPSSGLLKAVRSHLSIGVHVMIRPRSGDFLYSDSEYSVMCDDIEYAAECGADGVVFGLLTADGDVDVPRTRTLVERSRPMEVTFHRALDTTRDIHASLEKVIETGADRVLTSGSKPSAMLGARCIRDLVVAGADRIKIMAGGGVRAANVQEITRVTGAVEFHAALRSTVTSPVIYRDSKLHLGEPGRDEYARTTVLAQDVRRLREALDVHVYHPAQ
jgi:copper homeostasis protein